METLATQRIINSIKISEALNDFHFGGYAKTMQTDAFVKNFNEKSNFNIEPIYTGKVMYALNEFKLNDLRNQRILFIHTGGLKNIDLQYFISFI